MQHWAALLHLIVRIKVSASFDPLFFVFKEKQPGVKNELSCWKNSLVLQREHLFSSLKAQGIPLHKALFIKELINWR